MTTIRSNRLKQEYEMMMTPAPKPIMVEDESDVISLAEVEAMMTPAPYKPTKEELADAHLEETQMTFYVVGFPNALAEALEKFKKTLERVHPDQQNTVESLINEAVMQYLYSD